MINKLISFNKRSLQLAFTQIFTNRFNAWFSTSHQSLIMSMSEVKQGFRCYEQKNMVQATQYLQRSLNILPFYQQGNQIYNEQFQDIAHKLVNCYAWTGKTSKIFQLTTKILRSSQQYKLNLGSNIRQAIDTMCLVAKHQYVFDSQIKTQVKNNYSKIFSKEIQLRQLIKIHKNQEPDSNDLQRYLYGQLRSSTAYIFTSLLLFPSFSSNGHYNKLCNTLLKNAQKSSQKNIIKPLSILITNLLRSKQYLQAEGMVKYCLDRKRQNIKLNLLKSNQQYILLNMLLAFTYEGVDRQGQSKQIIQQFNNLFNLETYLVQHFLVDSF